MSGELEGNGVHRGVHVSPDQRLGRVAAHGPGKADETEGHGARYAGEGDSTKQGRGDQDAPSAEPLGRPAAEVGPEHVHRCAEGGEEGGAAKGSREIRNQERLRQMHGTVDDLR
jgi:hypothetical protein